MAAIQPINDWFGRETKMKAAHRTREEMRLAKAKHLASKVEYVDGVEITHDEAWFRHFNWQEKRAKVKQALIDTGASASALWSFENCGSDCQVEWSEAKQRYRIVGCYCHNRHCEPCMKAKSALITNNLRIKMQDAAKKQFRFITLTLRHSDAPLKQQIKGLYAYYKQLRQLPEWKASQKGGAATLEVKWQPHSKKWHPHLHIISEGTYLSTYWLSTAWRDITDGSHVVDIRLISAEKDVAYYVGKYVTKGTNSDVWEDPKVAAEWVSATKGVRMCATFGTWRGYKLLEREKEEKGVWTPVASLMSLVRRAQAGEVYALELLTILTATHSNTHHRKRMPKPK